MSIDKVDYITVMKVQTLEFHFYDGSIACEKWESTAGKDCWTDEYKDRQRVCMRKYMATSSQYSPFTTRIVCGCCGNSCRRQTQNSKTSETGKMSYWRCSGGSKTNYGIKGIREAELMKITSQVMGTPEFDGDAFKKQIGHITLLKTGLLEFTFLDSHTQTAEYSTKRKGCNWSDEQRAKFMESIKDDYTPERRKAMSENMKRIRSEKFWASKKVKTIPATLTQFTAAPIAEQKKRRVTGYARVSTDHDDQFTSYEAQIDYYTNYIKDRDDLEFVEVYTDEGISGTSTKRR